MSATSGYHSSSKPQYVPSDYDGLQHVVNFTPECAPTYTLRGKNENVEVPPISWGGWSWGDSATFHWSNDQLPGLQQAFKLAVTNGFTFIDTAQAYGSGRSEEILGDLIKNHSGGVPREQLQIQTKWLPLETSIKNIIHPIDAPLRFLKESLARMQLSQIDCYLVHGHIHIGSISQVAKGLAECVNSGLTKAVGVANYGVKDMLQMRDALAEHGIPLATNQCEYSILRRHPEMEGMLEACKQNDIIFQSYSSLAQGRLSGKYGVNNPAPKEYRFSSYPAEQIEPTLDVLRRIAGNHGVPVSAVTLNWNMMKGAIPVVGIRKVAQAEENMKAVGWRLSNEEIKQLDNVGFEGKETRLWQQG